MGALLTMFCTNALKNAWQFRRLEILTMTPINQWRTMASSALCLIWIHNDENILNRCAMANPKLCTNMFTLHCQVVRTLCTPCWTQCLIMHVFVILVSAKEPIFEPKKGCSSKWSSIHLILLANALFLTNLTNHNFDTLYYVTIITLWLYFKLITTKTLENKTILV